jgi:NMD protein affecting ribosome stability and mRNA decay
MRTSVTKARGARKTDRGKGRIRSLDQRGTRGDKSPPAAPRARRFKEPTLCESCGAVYSQKVWRERRASLGIPIAAAEWAICPACEQKSRGFGQGKVLLKGEEAHRREEEIRRRVTNVERRARHTQPERRIVSFERTRSGLEILTTSQKLAHRIAREVEKLAGGHVVYRWSADDNTLLATWRPAG